MINPAHLRDLVITPTLEILADYDRKMNSPAVVNLLLATIAHESLGGFHLKQIKGPALGIYQIEPDTHDDVWKNFLRNRPGLLNVITLKIRNREHSHAALVSDLAYATAIARLIYWRAPQPLPDKDDIDGLAKYWDDHYNCNGKHYSQDGFLENVNNVLDAML